MRISLMLVVKVGTPTRLMTADPLATSVAAFYTDHVSVEDSLLHDLFHHAAFGLDYEGVGEYFTMALDVLYPWRSKDEATPEKAMAERVRCAERLREQGLKVPSDEEVEAFQEKAKQALGPIDSLGWRLPIAQAIEAYLIATNVSNGDVLELTVDTHTQEITLRGAS